ncbi:MAG: hypothetical protein LBL41_01850 [Bifidobacteriaceae bacterium]|jgi:hypothetical protein|nr:hypothetical protein [Bifidobacteriaceae bacterium]
MMNGIKKGLTLVWMFVLVCTVSACSNPNTDTSVSPYAEDFAEAREHVTNDMQLEILADDGITEAEIKELTTLYTTCLREHDIDYDMDKYYGIAIGEGGGEKSDECRRSSVGNLQSLYQTTTINPTRIEDDELVLQCLIRREVFTKDFTIDEYKYYRYQNPIGFESTEDGTTYTDKNGNKIYVPVGEDIPAGFGASEEPIYFPNGVSLDDERVYGCEIDPRPESD